MATKSLRDAWTLARVLKNENTGKWLKRRKLIVEEMKSDIGKFIVIYYRIFFNLTDVNYRIQTTNNVLLRDLNLMIP